MGCLVEAHALIVILNTQPHGLIQDKEQHQGDDHGIGTGGNDAEDLDTELLEIAADQSCRADTGKETGCNSTPGATDAVDTEGVKGIIITEAVLHHHASVADDTRGKAHHQGPAGHDKTGSRGDDNET